MVHIELEIGKRGADGERLAGLHDPVSFHHRGQLLLMSNEKLLSRNQK